MPIRSPGRFPDAGQGELRSPAGGPGRDLDDEESPAAPAIPSFDSLRDPARRTAFDLLVPVPPAAPSGSLPRPAGAPRPAEWGDLVRLGLRVVHAVAGVPVRVAMWSVREPARRVHRLLGG